MSVDPDDLQPGEQLTVEGKLLVGAILVADLFERGEVIVRDQRTPSGAQALRALAQLVAAKNEFGEVLREEPQGEFGPN